MSEHHQFIERSQRWRTLRRHIRLAEGMERRRLLRNLGDEIRAIAADIGENATMSREMAAHAMAVADVQAVVVGAWLALDPANPTWPGRDRLFIPRREDLVTTCPVLAALGFFRPGEVAELLAGLERNGVSATIPGIEVPGAEPRDVPGLLWESAVESARSKRRWREKVDARAAEWTEQWWRESPAVWRTCALIDAHDAAVERYRDLPSRGGDAPAGLVVFARTSRDDAEDLAEDWRAAGWQAVAVGRDDFMRLYEVLIGAGMDKPLAVIFAAEQPKSATQTHAPEGEADSKQLGEMSDEEFNAILGESLDL